MSNRVSLETATKLVVLSWTMFVVVTTAIVFIKKYGKEYNIDRATGYEEYEMPNDFSQYFAPNPLLGKAAYQGD